MKKSAAASASQCAARKVPHEVLCPALWGRLDPAVLQDPLHRTAPDLVTETLHGPADSCVAPARILLRHTEDESGKIALRPWTAGATPPRAVVLPGDEPAVPAQDGVRRHDAGDFAKDPSAEHLALDREPASLVIRQPQPASFQLLAQQAVLLQQVLDHRELAPVGPAGEELNEEPEPYRQGVHSWKASTRCNRGARVSGRRAS